MIFKTYLLVLSHRPYLLFRQKVQETLSIMSAIYDYGDRKIMYTLNITILK